MTRDEIETAVGRELAGGLLPGIVSVYLFGGAAENRLHRESDVDLGVLLDRSTYPGARERFNQRVLLSARLSAALEGRTADVVILSDAPAIFARHIVTRGRRIFCIDVERDRCFVRDVQLVAADLEPFLRRMRRIKLEALGTDDLPRRTAG